MEKHNAVVTVNADKITEGHNQIDIYISKKYEHDPLDFNDNSWFGCRKDKRKASATKATKDGYEYLVYIEGKLSEFTNILVHVSDTDDSYWESKYVEKFE